MSSAILEIKTKVIDLLQRLPGSRKVKQLQIRLNLDDEKLLEKALNELKRDGLLRHLNDGTWGLVPGSRKPNPTAALTGSFEGKPVLVLERWQNESLELWENNGRTGIIEAVTGSGKTFVALGAIDKVRHDSFIHVFTLVVVPTVVLQEQWVARFEKFLPHLQVSRLGGGHHGSFSTAQVCVAVINSAVGVGPGDDGVLQLDKLFAHCFKHPELNKSLLVADECHRYVHAPVFSRIRQFRFDYSLALTATLEGAQQGEIIGYGKRLKRYTFAEAVNDNLVPRFKLLNVSCDFTSDERTEYQRLTDGIGKVMMQIRNRHPKLHGLSNRDFYAALKAMYAKANEDDKAVVSRFYALVYKRTKLIYNAEAKLRKAEQLVSELIRSGRKVIVFFERIAAAEKVSQNVFENTDEEERAIEEAADSYLQVIHAPTRGYKSVLHSRLSSKERKAALKQFEETPSGVMFCCRILDEGYDVPAIDGALLVASSQSIRQRIQRIGRALRAGKDKKTPIVITLYVPNTSDGHVTRRDEAEFSGAADVIQCPEIAALDRLRAILT